ncbi:MAG: hypothetical protein ABI650_10035 [Dokdonella sp.]
MQTTLTIAATLAVLIGVAHSVLGERLIFRHLRQGTLVPTQGAPPLGARNIRILWATWHLATVFGWAIATLLFALAASPDAQLGSLLIPAAVIAYAGGAILVLVGTRGRHPGWIALGIVAGLTWVAGGVG